MSHDELEQFEEMGPIDYVILEWPDGVPTGGEIAPLIIDLVDRGIIRILDIAFIAKAEDGSVTALDLENLDDGNAFADFEGASSGLLDFADLQEASSALEPGSAAAVLMWENRWAAPLAVALRKSGAQLVDSGRIPIQALLAALDALEAVS
jgi:hypothetical protein